MLLTAPIAAALPSPTVGGQGVRGHEVGVSVITRWSRGGCVPVNCRIASTSILPELANAHNVRSRRMLPNVAEGPHRRSTSLTNCGGFVVTRWSRGWCVCDHEVVTRLLCPR